MSRRRQGVRVHVQQCENGDGDFWYRVRGGNGAEMLTSEMYPTRSNAIRAARAFIALIAPVPVKFTYWVGPRPPRRGPGLDVVTELVR